MDWRPSRIKFSHLAQRSRKKLQMQPTATLTSTLRRVCHWLVVSRDLVVTLAYITGLVPPGRRVRARPTQSCMDASFPRLQRARAGHQDYSSSILLLRHRKI
ncbi:hypothetical protein PGIGA_G00136240 [Pangasianodon gigas]|uniref:Uncharacterized protein n=1 Tax=Pangasianodon gigas TaxID=30993 RepID=A0ACC5XKI7_PANGG|nr:hypothetical protein [Pangasianodon gigas]